MTFSILVAFSSYICSERLRSGPAALWISVWVLTQLKAAEPFVAASPCRSQPDAPRSPARRWHAPGSSLSLPVIPGRHFCERTCLQTNQAAVFSCRCLSAGDNSGFCLPTGNRPSAHHQHLPAPRGHFTWPNPRPAPGSAAEPRQHRHGNVPARLWRHHAGGRGRRLGSPSPWVRQALWEWFVLSCDSSSPLPRPPRASSEELMKSAGCGQPRCRAGMFWSRLLTLCFAYCVSNTTCFYTLRVNKGKGLSAQNEVLIGAVSNPAAPRCAARTPRGYSCITPAFSSALPS